MSVKLFNTIGGRNVMLQAEKNSAIHCFSRDDFGYHKIITELEAAGYINAHSTASEYGEGRVMYRLSLTEVGKALWDFHRL